MQQDPGFLLKSYRDYTDTRVDDFRKENIRSKLEIDNNPLITSKHQRENNEYFKKKNESEDDVVKLNELDQLAEQNLSNKIFSESFNIYQNNLNEQIVVREDFQKLRDNMKTNINEYINLASRSVFTKQVVDGNKKFVFGQGAKKKEIDLSQSISKEDLLQKNRNNQSLNKNKVKQEQQQVKQQEALKQKSVKYDFMKLNNRRIKKKLFQENKDTIGNLPTDIENIFQLAENGEEDLVKPSNMIDFFDDLKVTKDGKYTEDDVKQNKMVNEKAKAVYEDFIETFSNGPAKQNQQKNHFYRDLSPISRELSSKFEQIRTVHDCAEVDLLEEEEFLIQQESPSCQDLLNIVSGRINSSALNKLIGVTQFDEPISMPDTSTDRNQLVTDKSQQKQDKVKPLSKEEINRKVEEAKLLMKQQQQKSVEIQTDNIQPYSLGPSQEQQISMQKQSNYTSYVQSPQKNPQEQKIFKQMIDKTKSLLEDIKVIKQMKDDFSQIENIDDAEQVKEEMNQKLEQKLTQLLSIVIGEDENKIYTPLEIKETLRRILKNVDKLQGIKTSDGHLKTKLLFQFLHEYRTLQEEKDKENISKQTQKKSVQISSLYSSPPKKQQKFLGKNYSHLQDLKSIDVQRSVISEQPTRNTSGKKMDKSLSSLMFEEQSELNSSFRKPQKFSYYDKKTSKFYPDISKKDVGKLYWQQVSPSLQENLKTDNTLSNIKSALSKDSLQQQETFNNSFQSPEQIQQFIEGFQLKRSPEKIKEASLFQEQQQYSNLSSRDRGKLYWQQQKMQRDSTPQMQSNKSSKILANNKSFNSPNQIDSFIESYNGLQESKSSNNLQKSNRSKSPMQTTKKLFENKSTSKLNKGKSFVTPTKKRPNSFQKKIQKGLFSNIENKHPAGRTIQNNWIGRNNPDFEGNDWELNE